VIEGLAQAGLELVIGLIDLGTEAGSMAGDFRRAAQVL
jgi:hypothetical protein